jgi:hypothetical protein
VYVCVRASLVRIARRNGSHLRFRILRGCGAHQISLEVWEVGDCRDSIEISPYHYVVGGISIENN